MIRWALSGPALGAIVSIATLQGQDASLNRRDSGLLDPALRPEIGGQRRVLESSGTAGRPSDTGVDDYGEQEILVRVDEWQPFAFGTSFSYEYQTNAALSPSGGEEDFLFRESASGRGTFSMLPSLYADVGVRQQLYRYDELDLLDYDRIDVDAGILWVLPEFVPAILEGSVVTLKGTWYRMSEAGEFGEELFANTGLNVGLLKSVPLSRNHSLLGNVTADVSVDASEDAPQRHEYAALVAWQAQWAPRWESSVFLRATLYDYHKHDDWNLIAAASIDYVVKPWCRIGLSTSFSYNDSDVGPFDYENWTTGVNLRLSARF